MTKKFTSEINSNILRDIIPRLISSMKLRFKPTYKQVRDWLNSLHKHRWARLMYAECGTINKDNRKLHQNNHLSEVNKNPFYYYIKN